MYIKIAHLKSLSILLFLISVVAESQMLSPAMISQLKNMSPEQQRTLAGQYGIDLSMGAGIAGPSALDELGQKGEPLISEAGERLAGNTLKNAEKNYGKSLKSTTNEESIFESSYKDTSELPIFGQFLFDSDVTTYAPVDNAPVPDDYIIGVGDSLIALLYGSKNSENELVVDRSGRVNFPELGSLAIAGMTFSETKSFLMSRVKDKMIGVNLSLSIGKLRSINVFMAGEVAVPGNYSVSALSSISQMIYTSGGISNIGSLRNIKALRSGKVIAQFDAYNLLTKGISDGDIRLQSGDVVFVPVKQNSVFLDGSIKRPGSYEFREGETIENIISIAGGLSNRAYAKQISIERYDAKNDLPEIINIDLSKKTNIMLKLKDGDAIRIASVNSKSSNQILVKGAVQRPGVYGWYKGIKISNILNNFDKDLLNYTYLSKSLVVRRDSNGNRIKIIDFALEDIIGNLSDKNDLDLDLEPYDEILIFSNLAELNQFQNEEEYNFSKQIEDQLADNQARLEQEREIYSMNLNNDSTINKSNEELPDLNSAEEVDSYGPTTVEEAKKLLQGELIDDFISDRSEAYRNKKESMKSSRLILLKPVLNQLQNQASIDNPVKIVSISGAVRFPGIYPLAENAKFFDLIELAGGLSEDASLNQAEVKRIYSQDKSSTSVSLFDVDVRDILENGNSNGDLYSRDHIRIKNNKDWNSGDTVKLEGEIVYPGEYMIRPNEKLSSVIRRAGGFTNESFVRAALFTRESIKEKEREQLLVLGNTIRRDQASRSMTKESEDFSLNPKEIEEGIGALLSSEVYGRLIIDLPGLMNGDTSSDIVLQDGDVLNIPKYTNAVTVVGEVRRAGSFVRQETNSIDNYIELAAGMTERGNEKEIYVIRADGSVEKGKNIKNKYIYFSGDETNNNILAGDTIVVPIKSSYQTPLNLYSTVSQVVFQSIASIAAFTTVLK
jgi:polysaccharide biosynthesis/export protein